LKPHMKVRKSARKKTMSAEWFDGSIASRKTE